MKILHDAHADASANINDTRDDLVTAGVMAPSWDVADPLERPRPDDGRVCIFDDKPAPAGSVELSRAQLVKCAAHHLRSASPSSRHIDDQALTVACTIQVLLELHRYQLPPQGRCRHWYAWLTPKVRTLKRTWLAGKGAGKLAAPSDAEHRHRERGTRRRAGRAERLANEAGNAWAEGERSVRAAATAGAVVERGDGTLALTSKIVGGRLAQRRRGARMLTVFVDPSWVPAEVLESVRRRRIRAPKTETNGAQNGEVGAPKTETLAPKTETNSSTAGQTSGTRILDLFTEIQNPASLRSPANFSISARSSTIEAHDHEAYLRAKERRAREEFRRELDTEAPRQPLAAAAIEDAEPVWPAGIDDPAWWSSPEVVTPPSHCAALFIDGLDDSAQDRAHGDATAAM